MMNNDLLFPVNQFFNLTQVKLNMFQVTHDHGFEGYFLFQRRDPHVIELLQVNMVNHMNNVQI